MNELLIEVYREGTALAIDAKQPEEATHTIQRPSAVIITQMPEVQIAGGPKGAQGIPGPPGAEGTPGDPGIHVGPDAPPVPVAQPYWIDTDQVSITGFDPSDNRDPILQEALWHVDAAHLGTDKMIDRTGRGRDAVFGGTGTVVLPHSGEDYIYLPDSTDHGNGLMQGTTPIVLYGGTEAVITFKGRFAGTNLGGGANQGQIFQIGHGYGTWLMYLNPLGDFYSSRDSNADGWDFEQLIVASGIPDYDWHRFTYGHGGIAGKVLYEVSNDGVTWGSAGTCQHTGDRLTILNKSLISLYGGGSIWYGAIGKCYYASVSYVGDMFYEMRPSNVDPTYTQIPNTGTGGGYTRIDRSANSAKTAVVDRPLLSLDDLSLIMMPLPAVKDMTIISVNRWFGTTANAGAMGQVIRALDSTISGVYMRRGEDHDQTYKSAAGVTYSYGNTAQGQVVRALRVSGTLVTSFRDAQKYEGTVPAGWTGWAPTTGYMWGQFGEGIAMAIWDRALTDAEIKQAGEALSGKTHTQQSDPHPQYDMRWTTVPTWASLPPTGNWSGRQIRVLDGLGLCVALWDGSTWRVDGASDSGWRTVSSWTTTGVVTGRAIGATWEPYPGVAGTITARRKGDEVTYVIATGIIRAKQDAPGALLSGLPLGWYPQVRNISGLYGTTGMPWALELTNSTALTRAGNATIASQSINVSSASAIHVLDDAPWPTVAP